MHLNNACYKYGGRASILDPPYSTCSTNIFSSNAFFEPEVIEEWIDPFDSTVLKVLTVVVYIVEILASTIMMAFVSYETGGYAGHYRTAINQLLSYGYGGVRLYIYL